MSRKWSSFFCMAVVSTSAAQVGAESDIVLAEIAGETITRGNLEEFGAMVRRGLSDAVPAQSDSALLRALVDKEALLAEAGEMGIAGEPWFGRALKRFRNNLLVEMYEHMEVTGKVEITAAEMRAYFKESGRDRAVRISGILLPSRKEAEETLEELAAGADFAELAGKRSLYDPARDIGGDSEQYLNKDGTMPALQGIFDMEVGEVSEPIPVRYKGATNYAVIKVTDSIPVEFGVISLSLARARQRHSWVEELFQIKKSARLQALRDSLHDAYAPRLTDEVERVVRQFASGEVNSEADLSAILDRTLCVYRGGELTLADLGTLIPEANLGSEYMSGLQRVQTLLNDRAVPAQLYLEELRRQLEGEEVTRTDPMVANKRDDLLLSTVRNRGVDRRIPPPSNEAVYAYFEAHPEQFQTNAEIVVTEILVAFRELAQQLRDQLDAGEDAAELARAHTIRAGVAHHDGWLELSQHSRFPELYEKAQAIDVGEVAGPFRVKDGFSVLKVLEKRPPETKPFNEESQRRATGYLRIEATRRGFVDYVRRLREKHSARIYEERL